MIQLRLRSLHLGLPLLGLLLTACPKGQPGDACTASGGGFTGTDSCEEMCVAWEITCPSGDTITPNACSGEVCGTSGSCPSGQECVQVDSFEENSRCLPTFICDGAGGPGRSDDAASETSDDDLLDAHAYTSLVGG